MYYIYLNKLEDEEEDAFLGGEFNPDIKIDSELIFEYSNDNVINKFFVYPNTLRGNLTDNLHIEDFLFFVFSKPVIECLSNVNVQSFNCIPLEIIDPYSNFEDVQFAKIQEKELEYIEVNYKDYFVVDFLIQVDCVNHQASNIDYFIPKFEIPDNMPENMKEVLSEQESDNDIDFIRHLVLDESKIPNDIKIFRLKDCPRILVFKDEIVDAIKKAGLTGFVFIPLEEYTDEIPDDDGSDELEEEILEIELTEEQKDAKARYETQQEKSRIAYEAMQERIRIRRERGEGPSLV